MNRRKLLAVLAAGVLTLGVAGIALAQTLKVAHQGITINWDANGDPSNTGGIEMLASCDGVTPGEGEVIVHFVQSGQGTVANDGGASANTLDVWFTGADDVTDVPADSIQGGENANIDWYVAVSATGDSVTIDTAESNVAGGDLRISHICAGGNPPEATPAPTPTFQQSQATATDTPAPATDTPPPSFEQSQAADTDAPTEPNTAMVGGNGESAPGNNAWLLIVALGLLLGSVVVMTPAKAKNR